MVPDNSVSGSRGATIQSLDRGLQLLDLLSHAQEPMGLPELADALDVDRSTVHRLLHTLHGRGYVSQDEESRRFSLGLKVVELSRRAIDSLSLRIVAHPHLKKLVGSTGESANLVVKTDSQFICIDHHPSPSALAVTNEIGAAFAYHATAAGKVLLSSLAEEEQAHLLTQEPLASFTPRTMNSLEALKVHLVTVRQQGFAVDDEERFIGVRCIAAPILNHQQQVIAALSLAGPTARVTLDKLPQLTRLVQQSATEISAAMGCLYE